MISDSLEIHNSVGIIITETWLDNTILDAEVKIENYDTFRSDRKGRKRGGTAIFLRSELMCKLDTAYSNGVVETLLVKCKKLDTLFVSVYRPPDTKVNEWNEAISELETTIGMAQSDGNYGTIVMGRDFNLPNIKWENNFPKMELSLNNQEETFVDFLFKFCMFNYVDIETHKGGNTLDLILTNDTSLI